jgi:hypothetical protein
MPEFDDEMVEVPRSWLEKVMVLLDDYARMVRDNHPDIRAARATERHAADLRKRGDLAGARRSERLAAEQFARHEASDA